MQVVPSSQLNHAPRKTRVRRTAAQWQGLMDRFEASGLTQVEFCRQNEVAFGTFSAWRRKLADREAQPLASPTGENLFVEFAAQPPRQLESSDWDVELALGGGMVLRLRQSAC